jgi:hypothetical protein
LYDVSLEILPTSQSALIEVLDDPECMKYVGLFEPLFSIYVLLTRYNAEIAGLAQDLRSCL